MTSPDPKLDGPSGPTSPPGTRNATGDQNPDPAIWARSAKTPINDERLIALSPLLITGDGHYMRVQFTQVDDNTWRGWLFDATADGTSSHGRVYEAGAGQVLAALNDRIQALLNNGAKTSWEFDSPDVQSYQKYCLDSGLINKNLFQ